MARDYRRKGRGKRGAFRKQFLEELPMRSVESYGTNGATTTLTTVNVH